MPMKLKEAIQDMKDKRTNRLPDELFSYLCELGMMRYANLWVNLAILVKEK